MTEYQIAVNVLGRGKDYNLSDDSTVRNRAYELRQRLEKFYQTEQPGAEIRIEIPRGNYIPCFTRRAIAAVPAPIATASVEQPVQPGGAAAKVPVPQRKIWMLPLVAALILAIGFAGGYKAGSPQVSRELAEAWGPLAQPSQDVLIAIATNLHMVVRHISGRTPCVLPHRANFSQCMARPGRCLRGASSIWEPAQLSVPFAEMMATTTLARTLSSFDVSYQILPEAEAPITALRGRSAILIGSGTNSQAASICWQTSRGAWSISKETGLRW